MNLPHDRDLSWLDDASCADKDPTSLVFFPPRDKERYKELALEAKSFCYGGRGKEPCPVRLRCLWQAVNTDEQHGIWGGMSHRERNAHVRKWQRTYKSKMTLKEYIFTVTKEKGNGNS